MPSKHLHIFIGVQTLEKFCLKAMTQRKLSSTLYSYIQSMVTQIDLCTLIETRETFQDSHRQTHGD